MNKVIRLLAISLVGAIFLHPALAQQQAAHPVADWIKSAVVYEVNPRTFSVTAILVALSSVWTI